MPTTLCYTTAIQITVPHKDKQTVFIHYHSIKSTSHCVYLQELEFHSQNTAASTSQQDAMESLTNTRPLGKDISKEAIAIAHCLVDTSLKQLCKYPISYQ